MVRHVIRSRLGPIVSLAMGCAVCLSVGLRSAVTRVDSNHDGRMDIWEYHDGPLGTHTKFVEDTDFDGRADRISSFVEGALRRESDADLDGWLDQVEEFDVDGNRTRTVRDTDHDGTADLLLLYKDGVEIYSQRGGFNQRAGNLPSQQGSSLVDPFENETAVRVVSRRVPSLAGLASRSKPCALALGRASPSLRTAPLVSAVLTLRLQFDPRRLFPRGPPASDFVVL